MLLTQASCLSFFIVSCLLAEFSFLVVSSTWSKRVLHHHHHHHNGWPHAPVPWGGSSSSNRKINVPTQPASWPRRQSPNDIDRNLSIVGKQNNLLWWLIPRGGASPATETRSLDEKVRAALQRLGLPPPVFDFDDDMDTNNNNNNNNNNMDESCQGGVCRLPKTTPLRNHDRELHETEFDTNDDTVLDNDKLETFDSSPSPLSLLARKIATSMHADEELVWAALGATSTLSTTSSSTQRVYHERDARQLVRDELDRVATVPLDAPELRQLIREGFDPFLSRRALACADRNVPNARAILNAELQDGQVVVEQEEEEVNESVSDESSVPNLREFALETPESVPEKREFASVRESMQEKKESVPEKKELAQEKRESAQDKRESAQEKKESAQEKRESAQEKRESAQEKRESAQEKRESASGKKESAPEKESSSPVLGTSQKTRESAPARESTQEKKGSVPEKLEFAQEMKGSVSEKKESASARESVPKKRDFAQEKKESALEKRELSAQEKREFAPGKGESTPGKGESALEKKESAFVGASTPGKGDSALEKKESASVGASTPGKGESAFEKKESASVGASTPGKGESALEKEESASVGASAPEMKESASVHQPAQEEPSTLSTQSSSNTSSEKVPSKAAPNKPFSVVAIKSNLDPSKIDESAAAAPLSKTASPLPSTTGGDTSSRSTAPPKTAKKADVVFEATAAQIQELVLESPVPVLLDVYADWCGPCKALGPILEEMAIKSGGMFRLVKVNSDNERAVASTALQVNALPSIFGIKDGQIKNSFQGMPRSQEEMQNFMAGLVINESHFSPKVTPDAQKKYAELTSKLIKIASSAAFSFSARERLQDRINSRLDEMVQQTKDFVEAEEAASIIRALVVNIIRDPFAVKFRTIKLNNKVIAAKIANVPACLGLLKHLGFSMSSGGDTATLGAHRRIVNVAPLMVARDCIDNWVDKNRAELAAAARKRRDEEDRERIEKEKPKQEAKTDHMEKIDEIDTDACTLRVRLEGRKKVHELSLRANDTLQTVLKNLANEWSNVFDDEVQITCVAKKFVIKSKDEKFMKKSLRELGLHPSASLVIKGGHSNTPTTTDNSDTQKSRAALAERAKAKKKKKKGSHTMQSIGIYSKDDNAKAELIDGGGGTWYEHDVSDDDEEVTTAKENKQSGSTDEVENALNLANKDIEIVDDEVDQLDSNDD